MGYTTFSNVINFSSYNISSNQRSMIQQTRSETTNRARQPRQDLMIALAVEQETVIMQLMGKLTTGTISVFNSFLQTFADDGYVSFVFDLTDLSSMDSAGVVALTQANNQLKEMGGQATIINSSAKLSHKLSGNNLTLR